MTDHTDEFDQEHDDTETVTDDWNDILETIARHGSITAERLA